MSARALPPALARGLLPRASLPGGLLNEGRGFKSQAARRHLEATLLGVVVIKGGDSRSETLASAGWARALGHHAELIDRAIADGARRHPAQAGGSAPEDALLQKGENCLPKSFLF